MSWWKSDSTTSSSRTALAGAEQRREPRIGGIFMVRYSATDDQTIVRGHPTISDLSRHCFGLTGTRGLKQEMELAVFLELPQAERPLCIPKVRALWMDGPLDCR